ncbi:MAG: PIN domain-containing protein [Chloroflexota bacterium]|nr:MAG: PIN domain-containing protein [Chloroflexota bacterium]
MSFTALLDANVLWPAALRCTLVRAALRGLYRPVWTQRILDEVASSLMREGRVQEERIRRTVGLMLEALPHAVISGYENLIPVMKNDPKDRHVLAAAVHAGAGTIVTRNIHHFPGAARERYGIDLHTPDEFLLDLWDLNAPIMAEVVIAQAAQLRHPPSSPVEVVEGMRSLVPGFANAIETSGLLGYVRELGEGEVLREESPIPYSTIPR